MKIDTNKILNAIRKIISGFFYLIVHVEIGNKRKAKEHLTEKKPPLEKKPV